MQGKFDWKVLSILVVVSVVSLSCSVSANDLKVPTIDPEKKITSFDECVAAGNKVLRSYPARCVADGQVFVESVKQPVPELKACKDVCGNGQCEEMVCMAVGCPCAESHATCPQDCPG